MWHARRNEQHFTGADGHVDGAVLLHGPKHHVPLELVEELLAGIDMVVLTRIGPADDHDDEIAIAKDSLVPDRRHQLRAVGVDPLPQVERLQSWHVSSVRFAYGTRYCGGARSGRCIRRCCVPPDWVPRDWWLRAWW